MPRFFIKNDDVGNNNIVTVCGDDARHITCSLRMKPGDSVTLCDELHIEYECRVNTATAESVVLSVCERHEARSEPSIKVSVYQGMPKGQKFELIIQKCVELGAYEIVPVISSRCISRPDEKSSPNKLKRWNTIAKEAAMQSGRGIIPTVRENVLFKNAIAEMKAADMAFMCYEDAESLENSTDIKSCIEQIGAENIKTAALFVGPEGGIARDEAEYAKSCGIIPITLGKRILRTETAPMCALSCIMYATENLK